jgi:hypothetical protein
MKLAQQTDGYNYNEFSLQILHAALKLLVYITQGVYEYRQNSITNQNGLSDNHTENNNVDSFSVELHLSILQEYKSALAHADLFNVMAWILISSIEFIETESKADMLDTAEELKLKNEQELDDKEKMRFLSENNNNNNNNNNNDDDDGKSSKKNRKRFVVF